MGARMVSERTIMNVLVAHGEATIPDHAARRMTAIAPSAGSFREYSPKAHLGGVRRRRQDREPLEPRARLPASDVPSRACEFRTHANEIGMDVSICRRCPERKSIRSAG